jgi:3-isopropylmalate/(R)-2-methylmalate dehydratase large subunit
MGQTIAEKVLSRATGRPMSPGDVGHPVPDLITIHDYYVVNFDRDLQELGVDKLFEADKVLICTDHEPVATSVAAADRQKKNREIAKKYGVAKFFDAGRGGHGHIFPMELGLIRPGDFVLGYDMHVPNFGAVGAVGFYLGIEISELLACGTVWIDVPETIRINLAGKLPVGVTARDVSQHVISKLDADMIDGTIVEYGGPALAHIGFDGRMTLCNAPIEFTARSAVVEADDPILDWLRPRTSAPLNKIASDADATFKLVLDVDVSTLEPQVAVPPHVNTVVNVGAVAGKAIQHAYIGSCANSGIADLRDAARILRGRRVHDGVRLFVTPGTQEIATMAAQEGLLEIFSEAGAMMTVPGCGVCAVGRIGALADGEVSINTGTMNEYGRLGSKMADVYLGSPLTVAASAVAGEIADPRRYLREDVA